MNLQSIYCGSAVAVGLPFLALEVIIFAFNEKHFFQSAKRNGGLKRK
jgi:hypothetical protein